VTHIGGGAFSSVYRAREIDTDRTVALKLLNVHEVSQHALDSFRRETKALGPLSSHPNIVTLYRTFLTPQGMPVLVLELCRGSVADRVRAGGPLAPSRSVSIAIKIAGALETAHRAGMLHRDVKPQNILMTDYDEPALADFGLARLQSATEATAAIFAFTTLHAAPELLEGSPASPATDVYELASSLYQLLGGRAAFRSYDGEAPASVILRILRDPVAPLVRDGVPMALSDLLVQAMAKDPAARPPSMKLFAEALCAIESQQGWPKTAYAVLGRTRVADPTAPPSARAPAEAVAPAPPSTAETVTAGMEGVIATPAARPVEVDPAVRRAGPIDDLTATEAPLRFVDGSSGHPAPPPVLPDLQAGRRAGSTTAGHPCAAGHAVMVGEAECRRCGQAIEGGATSTPAPGSAPVRRLEWDAIESAHRATTPPEETGTGDHGGAAGERSEDRPVDGEPEGSLPRARRLGGRFHRPGSDGPAPATGDGPPGAPDAEHGRSGAQPEHGGSRPEQGLGSPQPDDGSSGDGGEALRRSDRMGRALPGVAPQFFDLARPSRVPGVFEAGPTRSGGALPGVLPAFGRGVLEPPPAADPGSAEPLSVDPGYVEPSWAGLPPGEPPPSAEAPSGGIPCLSSQPVPRPMSVRPSRQAPGVDILAPEGRKSEGKRTVSAVFRRRPREDPPAH